MPGFAGPAYGKIPLSIPVEITTRQANTQPSSAPAPATPPANANEPAQPMSPSALNLSTAERNELAQDPSVKAVIDVFGGSIVHYEVGPPTLFSPPPASQAETDAKCEEHVQNDEGN